MRALLSTESPHYSLVVVAGGRERRVQQGGLG